MEAIPRLVDTVQKAWVAFELIVEPILSGREAYHQSGWLAVAGNYDLSAFGVVHSRLTQNSR
jgi:hypothetical protein